MRDVLRILVLFSVVALLDVSVTRAQWAFDVGATLGVSRASLDVDDATGRTAFEAGALLRLTPPKGPVALQSEVLFAQKGTAIDANPGGELRYGANYIQLPLLLHAVGPSIRIVTPYVQAGGFGAVKIFERQSTGGDGLRVPIETNTSFYRRFDTGLVASIGAEIAIRDQPLHLTVRHTRGFVDVADDVGTQPIPDAPFPASGQTRVWTLRLELGL